jgi:hypothetical protein
MALRSTNTATEALQKLLSDIAMMKAMPDANLEFLVQIETAILQEIRSPSGTQDPAAAQQMAPPPPLNPQMAGEGGMRGLVTSPMGNMDEMRRMLGGA